MCDWKVFTVMLVVDQLTIFVESSPVPLVAHPNKFIGIGILIVYAPFNVSEFCVSYTHCLHTTNGDNPDRGIGPSYIVCFSILDAYRTRGCPYMAYRIRIDGTAQRQCKSMPDKLVRCKRSYPLFSIQEKSI